MTKTCPQCGQTYGANDSFCGHDGARLEELVTSRRDAASVIATGNRWARDPSDFAIRIEASDLKSLLSKGVAIEEGTVGLLFQSGKMVGTLAPGYHTVQTVADRIKSLLYDRPVSVILIDIAQTSVDVSIQELLTSDDQKVDADSRISVAVCSPLELFTTLMKGRNLLTIAEVGARLAGWVRESVEPVVLASTSEELYGNPEIRQRLELDLRVQIEDRLNRIGLTLVGVEQLQFAGHTDSEIRRQRGELNRQRALAEVDEAFKQLQDRLSSQAAQREMEQIRGDARMSQFLKRMEHELFRRDLMRQSDRDDLSRQYEERRADLHSARAHLLAGVELQRRDELARMAHDYDLADIRRRHAQSLVTLHNRGELTAEQLRQEQQRLDDELQGDLQRGRQRLDAELQEQRKSFGWDLERRRAEARLAGEIKRDEDDDKHRNVERAVKRYFDYKAGKQQLEHQDRRLTNELEQNAAAARHLQELERAATFNELKTEALIAMAPAEQAALLADLVKTETFKGMDETQIIALLAKDSVPLAQALAEKFRANGAGAIEAKEQAAVLYERMLAQQNAMFESSQAMQREMMRSQQELAQNAMNVQRDTASAAVTPNIISAGVSNPIYVTGQGRPLQEPTCPSCQNRSPLGSRFCQSCGTSLS